MAPPEPCTSTCLQYLVIFCDLPNLEDEGRILNFNTAETSDLSQHNLVAAGYPTIHIISTLNLYNNGFFLP
jgi:hypothetical protein